MRISLIEGDNDKLFRAYFCCIRKKRVEKKLKLILRLSLHLVSTGGADSKGKILEIQ